MKQLLRECNQVGRKFQTTRSEESLNYLRELNTEIQVRQKSISEKHVNRGEENQRKTTSGKTSELNKKERKQTKYSDIEDGWLKIRNRGGKDRITC